MEPVMMKKIIGLTFLLALMTLALSQVSCGDGSHTPRSQGFGEAGPGLDEGVGVSGLQCINVTNYEDITEEQTGSAASDDADDDTASDSSTAGETTRFGYRSTDAMSAIMVRAARSGSGSSSGSSSSVSQAIQRCIESKIDELEMCGTWCRTRWSTRTWLLTANRLYRRPLDSEINIVTFRNCEQVRNATCLVVD